MLNTAILCILWMNTLAVACGNDICQPSDELNTCYQKIMAFEAISDIHRHLDGDRDGEVDHSETEKFIQKELKLIENNRKLVLNSRDPLISILDLWRIWLNNPAYLWSVSETSNWLSHTVDLPQYVALFQRLRINGQFLPHLAIQNMSYLTDVLGIRNPIHKKKIMLKALDVVLFGPPKKSIVNNQNVSLFTMSIGLISIFVLGISKYVYHCSRLSVRKSLKSTNNECSEVAMSTLSDLQKRLEDVEKLRHSLSVCDLNGYFTASLPNPQDQLPNSDSISSCTATSLHIRSPHISDQLQSTYITCSSDQFKQNADETSLSGTLLDENLCNYETLPNHFTIGNTPATNTTITTTAAATINNNNNHSSIQSKPDYTSFTNQLNSPFSNGTQEELCMWLKSTYQFEMQQHHIKKHEAEKRMTAARQACARLYRKRSNILGSVLLMHTDNLDELENSLASAKSYLEQLQDEVRQRTHRWQRIEALTGLSICTNVNGATSVGIIQNDSIANSNKSSNKNNKSVDVSGPPPTDDDRELTRRFLLNKSSLVKHSDSIATPLNSIPSYSTELINETEGMSYDRTLYTNTKSTPTQNNSLVRPFAALWRRKVKIRSNKNRKQN